VTISVGGQACAGDYVAQAPAANCEGVAPIPDMSMPSTGKDAGTMPPPRDMAGRDLFGVDLAGQAAVGDPCHQHADCASHICATTGTSGFCTQACDPKLPNQCPPGFVCGLVDTSDFCIPGGHNGGGCAVAARPRSPTGALAAACALALAALFLRRRKARS
jgi:hypothetical protein